MKQFLVALLVGSFISLSALVFGGGGFLAGYLIGYDLGWLSGFGLLKEKTEIALWPWVGLVSDEKDGVLHYSDEQLLAQAQSGLLHSRTSEP